MVSPFLLAHVDHTFRGLVTRYFPQTAIKLYSRTREWYMDMLSTSNPKIEAPLYHTNVHGLKHRNDLMNAAGFDKNGDMLTFSYLMGAGGAVVGSVLAEENRGRLIRAFRKDVNPWTPLPYSRSAVNSLGLPSHGIEEVRRNVIAFKEKYNPIEFPIWVNVTEHPDPKRKNKKDGLNDLIREAIHFADGVIVNNSCPNTVHGLEEEYLIPVLQNATLLRDAYHDGHGKRVLLGVKERNMGENPSKKIEVLTREGVDVLVLTNTQNNYSSVRHRIDSRDRKIFDFYTENYQGGVSGQAIKEIALSETQKAVQAIREVGSPIKIIRVGGIAKKEDLFESRILDSHIIKLNKWFTGLMEAIATQTPDKVYRGMFT